MIDWLYKKISVVDLISFIFVAILIIFFFSVIKVTPYLSDLIIILVSAVLFIFFCIWLRNKNLNKKWKRLILFLYPIILLLGIFETIHMMLHYFNSNRFDALMVKIDYLLLGCYITVWFEQWIHPLLTEIMYIFYISYYFPPFIIIGWLLKNKKYKELEQAFFYLLTCFYGGYIIYFFVPVAGPRFFLSEFHTVPLAGYFFAGPVREFIDFLEPNKLDAFPSLHTATLMSTIFVTYLFNKKMFYVFVFLSIGVFLSIFYCRYHYFVDFLAGFLWAVIAFIIAHLFYQKYHSKFVFHFKE